MTEDYSWEDVYREMGVKTGIEPDSLGRGQIDLAHFALEEREARGPVQRQREIYDSIQEEVDFRYAGDGTIAIYHIWDQELIPAMILNYDENEGNNRRSFINQEWMNKQAEKVHGKLDDLLEENSVIGDTINDSMTGMEMMPEYAEIVGETMVRDEQRALGKLENAPLLHNTVVFPVPVHDEDPY